MTAALLAAALIGFAWEPPPEMKTFGYMVSISTNAEPMVKTQFIARTNWSIELPPGKYRVGVQSVLTNGILSEVESIGFEVQPKQSLTLLDVVQEATDPNGPWTDFAAVAVQIPAGGAGKFYRTTGKLIPPAQPITTNAVVPLGPVPSPPPTPPQR